MTKTHDLIPYSRYKLESAKAIKLLKKKKTFKKLSNTSIYDVIIIELERGPIGFFVGYYLYLQIFIIIDN